MATARQIQDLFQKVNVIIDKEDIVDSLIDFDKIETIGKNIIEFGLTEIMTTEWTICT